MKFCVFFLVLFNLAYQASSDIKLIQTFCQISNVKKQCKKKLEREWNAFPENSKKTYCKGEFESFFCWPHTQPEAVAFTSCPSFVESSENVSSSARRYCLGNGSWYGWKDIGECNFLNIFGSKNKEQVPLVETLTTIYRICYAISYICLVLAIFILSFFKKLHCKRNYIHINLMLSFILRYTAMLTKDRVLEKFYHHSQFMSEETNQIIFDCETFAYSSSLIFCRFSIVFFHYALTSNYFWIFAEGIHLQLLMKFPMKLHKSIKCFPFYLIFGWGGPWIFIGIWIAVMLSVENLSCWDVIDNDALWYIIRGPVIATIIINFIIFINVTRIIISQLRAHSLDKNDYRYSLAKSTLGLIPLLGIHYMVFVVVNPDFAYSKTNISNAQIAFELVFTSIQGTLVAIFYCFINCEVRGEIRKRWKKWQAKRNFKISVQRKPSCHTTQNTSLLLSQAENKV